jgi:hypothetical protein
MPRFAGLVSGALLIESGDPEGLGVLTSALTGLDKGGRPRAVPMLVDGINRMQIPFIDSKGTLRPNPKTKEEAVAFLDEWSMVEEKWSGGAKQIEGLSSTHRRVRKQTFSALKPCWVVDEIPGKLKLL